MLAMQITFSFNGDLMDMETAQQIMWLTAHS